MHCSERAHPPPSDTNTAVKQALRSLQTGPTGGCYLHLLPLRGASQRDERKYEHLEQHSPTALASGAAAASQTPATLTLVLGLVETLLGNGTN